MVKNTFQSCSYWSQAASHWSKNRPSSSSPLNQKLPVSSCSPFPQDQDNYDVDCHEDTSMKLSCFWSLEFCSLNKLSSSIMQQRLSSWSRPIFVLVSLFNLSRSPVMGGQVL